MALAKREVVCRKQDVQYRLAFPDSEEDRLSIMRFLLGSYFGEVPHRAMVDLFNPYAQAGRIAIPIVHEQFVIRHRRCRS